MVTITETRKTYSQNWPAYNAAQVNEKALFQSLLRDLCRTIPEPERTCTGRKPLPLADAIFAATFKVYSTVSGRRFMTDMRDAHDKGHVGRLPCYNSIFNVFDDESTFDVLQSLVVKSAAPLTAIETKFACDSSGFSSSRFDRWFDHKYGENRIRRAWVKAHVMCGVKTNIVTAVEIHDQHAGDAPLLEPLLNTTAKNFTVKEVSADLGYSSAHNLHVIKDMGAAPLIPFKVNATPAMGGLWGRCYHYFSLHREHFLARYHLRSNVESTFSMVKAKFGDSVRSKLDVAMKNEVLAKFLCHNICCLISAIYELGLSPTFLTDDGCPKTLLPAQELTLN
ncbi:MAG: transposase [Pirellulaceae bacterium]